MYMLLCSISRILSKLATSMSHTEIIIYFCIPFLLLASVSSFINYIVTVIHPNACPLTITFFL